MADVELDMRGHACPLPISRAAKQMLSLSPGQTLRVLTSDPGSVSDFDAYARGSGNLLLESKQLSDREYAFVLQKKKK